MLKVCKGCGKDYEPRHAKDYRCTECYAKAGRRSKRKGSANESRFTNRLQELFDKYELKYRVIRTPRSGAISQLETADALLSVPTDSIFSKLHIELKNSAGWSIEEWFSKAIEQEKDNGRGRNPILVLRKPNSQQEYLVADPWFVIKLMVENDILNNKLKQDE